MRGVGGVLAGVCAVAFAACWSSGAPRDTPEEGRGTAACRQWQDSVCDWALRCQAAEREVCDAQFQGVICKSDATAMTCANAWDGADCRDTPARCGMDEIADPAPAARACGELTSQFCQRSTACGITATEADCLSAGEVDCSRSVAYRLEYETCLDRIEELECEQVRLPEVCERVIIARP